jgi:glycosyl transferase family 25
MIDHIVYINLESRTDRKQQVEKELSIFPSEKVTRFDAIKQEPGGIGCSMSHAGALKLAIQNNWKNVLIVEDDVQWTDLANGMPLVKKLAKNPFDVICLSGHGVKFNYKTYKLESCHGRTAYLVNNHYFKTLLANFEEGLQKLQQTYTHDYRGDVYWNKLQKKDNWYIIMPQMCIQRPSFSDIENKFVDYTFLIKKPVRKFINGKFIL